jgi:hypothetical protein
VKEQVILSLVIIFPFDDYNDDLRVKISIKIEKMESFYIFAIKKTIS